MVGCERANAEERSSDLTSYKAWRGSFMSEGSVPESQVFVDSCFSLLISYIFCFVLRFHSSMIPFLSLFILFLIFHQVYYMQDCNVQVSNLYKTKCEIPDFTFMRL